MVGFVSDEFFFLTGQQVNKTKSNRQDSQANKQIKMK